VRGEGDAPDIEAGVAAIRNVLKTLPVRPGVYRMQDARGDVLYVGKARALKNRVANYTQVDRAAQAAERMVAQTRGDDDRHHQHRGRGAAARGAADQALPPAYNVLLRDDKSFPFILLRADHDFPRVQLHRGARRAKGNISARSPAPARSTRRSTRCRSCSCCALHRQLLRQPRAALPALPDQALLGAVRRSDQREDYAELVDDAKDVPRGKSTQVQTKLGARCRRRPRRWISSWPRSARPAEGADLHPGQPGDQRRGVGDADVFALASKGA
jgi:excinuclease ABC subunit C